MACAVRGETDAYGNDVFSYQEGGTTKEYRFWVSGDTVEVASKGGTSAVSWNEDVALDAVFKSVLASAGGWLYSIKSGLIMIFR